MALSRLPKLRGLVGMLALIGALAFVLLLAPGAARALDTAGVADSLVMPTAESAVPAAATAAIPESPAAAVPAAAAAAVPSSPSAAVPSSADGGAIASHVLQAVHAQASASGASGGSTGAGAPQPDPVPVTAARPIPTDAQALSAQPEAEPAPAAGRTVTPPKPPKPDKPGAAAGAGGHKSSTSGRSAAAGKHEPPASGSAYVRAPAASASSAPTLAVRPVVTHPARSAPNTLANVKKGASADRRSRSPKPAAVDVSTPLGGLVPASGSLPPAGAGAGGVGAGAATLLALVALCLLGTLLPGLLRLEMSPWRSADYAMRLERPG